MDYREFNALDRGCEASRKSKIPAPEIIDAGTDVSAIHGRPSAQVALLQSPILPAANVSYTQTRKFRGLPLDKPHTCPSVVKTSSGQNVAGCCHPVAGNVATLMPDYQRCNGCCHFSDFISILIKQPAQGRPSKASVTLFILLTPPLTEITQKYTIKHNIFNIFFLTVLLGPLAAKKFVFNGQCGSWQPSRGSIAKSRFDRGRRSVPSFGCPSLVPVWSSALHFLTLLYTSLHFFTLLYTYLHFYTTLWRGLTRPTFGLRRRPSASCQLRLPRSRQPPV